jgi:phenylpropionate dioxygenase-like ring-hydroxylating dioxygenase large terminal subunit
MTTSTTAAPATASLALGLRNRWYAVCPSGFVAPGTMRRIFRWGEPWLLFREPDGQLHMLADRCPHRGAPLSLGSLIGDRVACAYHGVQVDGTGQVVSVPGLPGCALEGKQAVRSLPVREAAGVVLAYLGDDQHRAPVELTLPEPLTDPDTSRFLAYAEWDTPWRFALENVLDPMHGTFLHRNSHTMYTGDKAAKFQIRETDRGFVFEKTTQSGVNFDWVEFAQSGIDWLQLAIPYPPSAGPGGPFGIVGMVTPIDEKSCSVFFWRFRRVVGWERAVWRFLYVTKIEERHWHVLEQDRTMLEGMAADADQHENLYQHDLGIVRIRRMMSNIASSQGGGA